MIQSHLYAKENGIAVYNQPSVDGQPVVYLKKGDWLGVVEQMADSWIKIISATCDGWVRTDDLEARSPFHLHAIRLDDQSIQYISRRA